MIETLSLLLLSATPCPGKITHATARRSYVDVGTEGGLPVGTNVEIRRRGRRVGSCKIDGASALQARCSGVFEPGDRVCFSKTLATEEILEPTPSGPEVSRVSANAAERNLASLQHRLHPLRENEVSQGEVRLRAWAEAVARHDSLVLVGVRDGFHTQQIDFSLLDVELGFFDLRGSARLSAWIAPIRPGDARFRNGADLQLYVYETAIRRREVDSAFVGAVGRFTPHHTPGIAYLDGVQLGWQAGLQEIGFYAGGLPDPFTLDISTRRWTSGLYGQAVYSRDNELRVSLSGRAGAQGDLTDTVIAETELDLSINVFRRFRFDAGGRLAYGGDGLGVSRVRAFAEYQPTRGWSVWARGRFRDDLIGLYGLLTPNVVPAIHSDVGVRWATWAPLSLTLLGGAHRVDGLFRGHAELNAHIRDVIPETLDITVGYRESRGWWSGRSAYLHFMSRPARDLRLGVRVLYNADAPEEAALQEVGGFADATWRITDHIEAQLSGGARVPVADVQSPGSPIGIIGRFQLRARY